MRSSACALGKLPALPDVHGSELRVSQQAGRRSKRNVDGECFLQLPSTWLFNLEEHSPPPNTRSCCCYSSALPVDERPTSMVRDAYQSQQVNFYSCSYAAIFGGLHWPQSIKSVSFRGETVINPSQVLISHETLSPHRGDSLPEWPCSRTFFTCQSVHISSCRADWIFSWNLEARWLTPISRLWIWQHGSWASSVWASECSVRMREHSQGG